MPASENSPSTKRCAAVALTIGVLIAASVTLIPDKDSHQTVIAAAARPAIIYRLDDDVDKNQRQAPTTTQPPPPTTHYHPPQPRQAPPAPQPAAATSNIGGAYGDPYSDASWDQLAQCESNGNWAANTGNGYYGGLQFSQSSWRAVGGSGYPHENSRAEQIHRGRLLWEQGGWAHWPGCTSKFGWR